MSQYIIHVYIKYFNNDIACNISYMLFFYVIFIRYVIIISCLRLIARYYKHIHPIQLVKYGIDTRKSWKYCCLFYLIGQKNFMNHLHGAVTFWSMIFHIIAYFLVLKLLHVLSRLCIILSVFCMFLLVSSLFSLSNFLNMFRQSNRNNCCHEKYTHTYEIDN